MSRSISGGPSTLSVPVSGTMEDVREALTAGLNPLKTLPMGRKFELSPKILNPFSAMVSGSRSITGIPILSSPLLIDLVPPNIFELSTVLYGVKSSMLPVTFRTPPSAAFSKPLPTFIALPKKSIGGPRTPSTIPFPRKLALVMAPLASSVPAALELADTASARFRCSLEGRGLLLLLP